MAVQSDLWSVEHLKLTIGRQTIFDDAEFSIGEGERLALTGRNGSGKSTLLKIIAGIEQPSSGDVAVRRDLSFLAALTLGVLVLISIPSVTGYTQAVTRPLAPVASTTHIRQAPISFFSFI